MKLSREYSWSLRHTPKGPLVPYINAFTKLLSVQGYAQTSVHGYTRLVADFSAWLKQRNVTRGELTLEHAKRYLKCRARRQRPKTGELAPLKQLLHLLHKEGVIALVRTPSDVTFLQCLLDEYALYLRQERAVAPATLATYLRFVRCFLTERFGKSRLQLSQLRAADVVQFVQQQAGCFHRKVAKLATSALRSFLRFARYRDYISADLAAAVPTVAGWSMTSIPRSIEPDYVRRILAQCDRQSAVGCRDYAILLLLARLGLRAGEVASLKLEDIDWKAGCLTVGSKPHSGSALAGRCAMNTLRSSLQDYLAMRRGLGFKLRDTGSDLLNFVSFMEQKHASYITTELALEWAQKPKSTLPAHWAKRLSFVRCFARYRSTIDPRTQVPPASLLPYRPQRARPYIYTEQEIERLLAAARSLPPAGGRRSWMYYCLFGLLSVAGLRISEALNLKLTDLDLQKNVLTIQNTKFGKSRLVPLHSSTVNALSEYLRRRIRFLASCPASHLFVTRTGNRLDISDVHRTFYALSRQIGLRGPLASRGPRLHDFRHRFAVQTLLRWYRDGQEVEARLPILSTYLGHTHVSDTYWYLTAHPELLGQAVNRLEQHWEGAS